MNRNKSFLFFAILVSCAGISNAQVQVHLGATTAYNATFVLDKGLAEDPRYNSTYTYKWSPAGFSFGVDFGRKFGLSLESILSKQGQVYEVIDAANKIKGERKIDLSYVSLPLLMKFMSGGSSGVRGNFNIGPQLSVLTDAVESVQADAGTYTIPDGLSFEDVKGDFPEASQTAEQAANNTYSIPDVPQKDILSKKANDFKNAEFQIATAFGLDIDLSKHLFLTTQVRANYSLTDMRNGDVIDKIKGGDAGDVFGQRANLLVGVQIGIHYTFGITRSFKEKSKED